MNWDKSEMLLMGDWNMEEMRHFASNLCMDTLKIHTFAWNDPIDKISKTRQLRNRSEEALKRSILLFWIVLIVSA